MASFFAARVLLSEVLLWMAPPPGSPTTEDIHGMLRIETKHVRDETLNNAHELYFYECYYMGPTSAHDHDHDL